MSSLYVAAQGIHEYSVYASGGFSALRYQLSLGERSGGGGGDFGLGYTYFRTKERVTGTGKIFQEYWGIHTGLGFGLYNAKASVDNQETIQKGLRDNDGPGDLFDLYTTLSGYKETQRTVFLNIPVMAQFHLDQYYVMGGFKFGIPLSGKYTSKNATLTT